MKTQFRPPSRALACTLAMAFAALGCGGEQEATEPVSAGTSADNSANVSESISDQEVIERFYHIWSDPKKPTFWQNKWMGISTLQNPMDVWVTQEIIYEVKPDFIVEAGTFHGGSAVLWAMVLEQVNPDGRIITMDIDDNTELASGHPLWSRKIEFIHSSSTAPETVARIAKQVAGKTTLVILDSAHTKQHVLDELNAYSPMVTKGSYLIVQDSVVNGHPIRADWGPGPYEAIDAWQPEKHGFEIDKSKERLILTFNPNGFLKKVR